MMAEGPNSSPSLEGGSKVEGITSTSTSTCDSTQSKRDNSDFNGSVFLITSEGKTLNLPIPANDSHDPLNWTSKKRAISFATLLIFSTVSLVTVLGPSMMFESLAKDFPPEESEPFQVTLLLSAPSLFQGIASFLWIPLSLAVGRRPVLLLAALTLLVATIWAAFSTTFGSLLAAVCVVGVVQGAAMSVVFLIVIDLTFIHQRPLAIAMVWSFAGCVSPATLSLSQALHPGREWRNFYLISIIPSSISLALIYFLFTETYFTRPAVAFDGHIVVQSAAEDVKIYNGWEQVPGATGARDTPQNPDQGVWKWTTKELKFWGKTRGGWNAMFACYPQILLCLLNPLVFWVTLLQAAIFGSMLILGQTYVQVLQSEPYFLPAYAIDLVNLARALGSVLAWPGAGLMVVRITRKLAMSNKGVRDAEHYLPAFILPIITSALSLILYGLTAQHKWHWIWVYISYVLSAFSFSAMATASSLWITEAFPRWAAPAMVVVSGISYIASFGIAFSIHPWVESQGYSGAGMEMAWIILVVGLIGVPIAFWGKKLRQYIDGKWAFNEMGALRPQ
ncbi:major facilitator superfamily transporter [Rhexocercosporidium sp. MPI-PUGE-AT-0058]|nr:major facilitator superfamily transporter [Rhexocercosporidium sp. MPI-PUGE-AT-0058]